MTILHVPSRNACALLLLLLLGAPSPASALRFVVDESGYHPAAPKTAILEDVPEDRELKITLVDPEKKDLLGREKLILRVMDARPVLVQPPNGPATHRWIIDFSSVTAPGSYRFQVEGNDAMASPPVKVSEFLYWDALKPVVRGFFLQRCGQDIDDGTNQLFLKACHTEDALLPTPSDDFIETAGGWHDLSTDDKSVVTTSLAVSRLLTLYEWNPKPFQFFSVDYPVTEPRDGKLPDLLHETAVGLDWLMSMQRLDGGFYSGVSGEPPTPANALPEEDHQTRRLSAVSPRSTAAATATLAMAARVYRKKDLGYAVKTLMAAERGWKTLVKDPASINLPERAWAATELALSTRKPVYQQELAQYLAKHNVLASEVLPPALVQALADDVFHADRPSSLRTPYRQWVTRHANTLVRRIQQDSFGRLSEAPVMTGNELDQVVVLLHAYRLTGEDRYRFAATRSLHSLFGLNPLGTSAVTGLGEGSTARPTRLMQATKKSLPGFIATPPTPPGEVPLSLADHATLAYILGGLNLIYNVASQTGE